MPLLLDALGRDAGLDHVPNLVIRAGPDTFRMTKFE